MEHTTLKAMTHKQLANIVLNPESAPALKDAARAVAITKKPWKPLPQVKKKKEASK